MVCHLVCVCVCVPAACSKGCSAAVWGAAGGVWWRCASCGDISTEGNTESSQLSLENKLVFVCAQGEGLEELEEAILAQAEQCDTRGDPGGMVEGTVIETKVDKGLG